MQQVWSVTYEALTWTDLSSEMQEVVKAARHAAEKAYAPYSGFPVGAAVRLHDGRIFTGNNQENAAYPSGLCAERTLAFYLGSQHLIQEVELLAVYAPLSEGPVMPCGACRQVLHEYEHLCGRPWVCIFAGASPTLYRFIGIQNLLPFAFVWKRS